MIRMEWRDTHPRVISRIEEVHRLTSVPARVSQINEKNSKVKRKAEREIKRGEAVNKMKKIS